jgi:hypothetical protein
VYTENIPHIRPQSKRDRLNLSIFAILSRPANDAYPMAGLGFAA